MSGHLEDPHDPEDPQHLANLLHRVQLIHKRRDEVGKDGQQVDNVHEALDELAVVRAGEEPHQELYREPGHVDGLQNVDHGVGV